MTGTGLPRIAVSLGDPRGVGPEITLKALRASGTRDRARFLLVGPDPLPEWERYGAIPPGVEYASVGGWRPTESPAAAGAIAGLSIEKAVALALAGEVDAVVTAPIDKSAFHQGGWNFPGHTEMLQHLSGASAVGMMMSAEGTDAAPSLRVVLATTHIALRDVSARLSPALLVDQCQLAAHALRAWWEIDQPRLALCAVNPHASDGGLFGDEEQRILAPALHELRRREMHVSGPVPADTVFSRALRGEFDAVIAPYHDVGMAAFKTATFGRGVNVTLGLPFPRTSPDHGTALDIAGQDRADPSSMGEAIRLAAKLAERFDSSGFPV